MDKESSGALREAAAAEVARIMRHTLSEARHAEELSHEALQDRLHGAARRAVLARAWHRPGRRAS